MCIADRRNYQRARRTTGDLRKQRRCSRNLSAGPMANLGLLLIFHV